MADTVEEGARNAPKFHTDRSAYGDAFRAWFERQRPAARHVEVSDIDIPVATGFSNETVFFEVTWEESGSRSKSRFVARIEPDGGALFPVQTAHTGVSVGLQHRVMSAVARASEVPVPPLLGYEPDPALLGKPFFVMWFVPGVIPADSPRYSEAGFLVDEATPDQRRAMVCNGLDAMAGIHAIDWRNAGLEWLDASGAGAPTNRHQVELYRRFATELLAGRSHPVLDASLTWLAAHDPGDDRVGLTWGDARLGNIIWQDYQVGAVVDWEACALSPTEADVGWWLMFDRMSFEDLGVERMAGYPTREEMIAHYEAASGRAVHDPHYWEIFGAMRFCAIFIRLADRMVGTGLVPEELNMPVANQVTDALARLLEIENPTPSAF